MKVMKRTGLGRRALLGGLGVIVLLLSACGGSSSPTGSTQVRIGYLSGGNADPFVFTVTTGIRAAAAGAGAKLFECDGNFDDSTAVKCAQTFAGLGLGAVINWQFTGSLSPAVCKAYGNLPTVSMDTQQKPCSKVFVGVSNEAEGEVGGAGLGTYMQSQRNCQYDLFVSIENRDLPDVFDARGGGTRKGFESVCGAVSSDKYVVLNKVQGGSNRALNIRTIFANILTTHPNAHTILVSAPGGDADGETAFATAQSLGRGKDLLILGQGADTSSCAQIRNNPQWVGDVAFFPEQYAGLAVPAAIALAKGQSTPANDYIKNEFITKANIDQYYPACF